MVSQLRFEAGDVRFEVDELNGGHRFLAVDPDVSMMMSRVVSRYP